MRREEQKVIDGILEAIRTKDKARFAELVQKAQEMQIDPDRIINEAVNKKLLPSERAILNVPEKRLEQYKDVYRFR